MNDDDWATKRALDILRHLRWTDWLTSQAYLTTELLLIHERGIAEGLDRLRKHLAGKAKEGGT